MFNLQLTLAFRYLWGRKLRTVLTTLAIVLGTLVIFGMNIILPTMMNSFKANLMAVSGQVDVTITQKNGEAFTSRIMTDIKGTGGIRAIAGSLSRTINIPAGYYGKAAVNALSLTGIDPAESSTIHSYMIKEGRFLRPSDSSSAVISSSLAQNLEIGVGDKLNLPTTEGGIKLKIVGLLPNRAQPGNEEVLVTLQEAQKLLDLPNRINTVELNLESTDDSSRQAVTDNIEVAIGDNYVIGALSSGSEMLASIQTGQAAFNLFGFLALFMGGFIIFNTFRTVVAERRHDIGMLRAIGASRGTIIGMFLVEGLLQGAFGTLAGMLLGYLMGAGLLKLMGPLLTQFIHLEMGAPVVQTGLIFTTIALGLGVTLAAGLLPALSASRVTPLEAIRPTIGAGIQRTAKLGGLVGVVLIVLAMIGLLTGNTGMTSLGGLMLLIGIVMVAPLLITPISSFFSGLLATFYARQGIGTLAQSNLVRHPSRSAITASATMVGLAIIVGLGGMLWSITGNFLDLLQRSLGSDFLVMPPSVAVWGSNVGAKQDLAEKLNAVPGVEVVSSMRFAAGSLNGTPVSLLGIKPEAYQKVASLTFLQGDASSAFAQLSSGRVLIVNGVMAARTGVKPGETVQLSTSTGVKDYLVVGVASDYLNAKVLTAYTSQDNLRTDFHKNEDILYQINLAKSADADRAEQKLKNILDDYPQFKLMSGKNYFNENKEIFNAVFAVYFILLGVLAAPSLLALLNTLAIGVIERTREIGMLRAIGATRKQVRSMVIAESLLLAAIGTAFGLLAGLYLGYVMVLGMSSGGYPITYAFPYAGLLAAIATGLIFGVLAGLLPARQAARMEIVQALRYE